MRKNYSDEQKKEIVSRYRSEKEFKESIDKYIEFYNSKRPHKINRNRTPNDTENEYFNRHKKA